MANHRYPTELLALALAACLALSGATGAVAAVPMMPDISTKRTCHDERTVMLVAAQFGTVLVVKGKRVPAVVAAAWRMTKSRPPVASKLFIVMSPDGIVRMFAIHEGCVQRTLSGSANAFIPALKGLFATQP